MKSVNGSLKSVSEIRNQKTGNGNYVRTFRDLRVYQNLYKAQVIVLKDILPRLPKEEQFDLVSQMRRGCKAPPARIAEAFAQRYQPKQWRKSIDDTLGECYEMQNHLSVCIDIYGKFLDVSLCEELIDMYDLSCAQLTKLRNNWRVFHQRIGVK